MHSPIPNSLNCESIAAAASPSSITTVSVISNFKQRASTPVSCKTCLIWSIDSGSENCLPERFTATVNREFPAGKFKLCHLIIWRQLSFKTHKPKGIINPVSSAIAINSIGETKPRSGCSQRTSASNPIVEPLFKQTIG